MCGRTDGRMEWMDGRTDDAKTISLRLRQGIKKCRFQIYIAIIDVVPHVNKTILVDQNI